MLDSKVELYYGHNTRFQMPVFSFLLNFTRAHDVYLGTFVLFNTKSLKEMMSLVSESTQEQPSSPGIALQILPPYERPINAKKMSNRDIFLWVIFVCNLEITIIKRENTRLKSRFGATSLVIWYTLSFLPSAHPVGI